MIDPISRFAELIDERSNSLDAHTAWVSTMLKLAAEIRAEENEACAKVCDKEPNKYAAATAIRVRMKEERT